eukprot:gene3574-biopygen3153
MIHGVASQDALGLSVSGAGDVNGDGIDDMIVGALRASDLYTGAVYVIYGVKGLRTGVVLTSLMPLSGFALKGPANS